MNNLNQYIQEKLNKINSKNLGKSYEKKYFPKNKKELIRIINKLIYERGKEADLNDIDTSKIEDMSMIFQLSCFNGDISDWDVSNVTNMREMFYQSNFDGDISMWNVSKVKDMNSMFVNSKFTGKNGDIGEWDVSNVSNAQWMFYRSKFEGNIDNWKLPNFYDGYNMFLKCPLEKNPPKWYKY